MLMVEQCSQSLHLLNRRLTLMYHRHVGVASAKIPLFSDVAHTPKSLERPLPKTTIFRNSDTISTACSPSTGSRRTRLAAKSLFAQFISRLRPTQAEIGHRPSRTPLVAPLFLGLLRGNWFDSCPDWLRRLTQILIRII